MSENEFELYLSLLGKFLRLKPGQRSEIADELRDHLEARLEELSKAGLTREQAIHAALEEFGDAADLANHFSQIAQRRRRRFLMRCTLGTVACLTAAILFSSAFWPGNQGAPVPQNAAAQGNTETKPADKSEKKPEPSAEPRTTVSVEATVVTPGRDELYWRVVGELKKKTTLAFTDTSLREVMEYISQLHKIPVNYNMRPLDDAGVDVDKLKITYNLSGIPLSTALDLILENVGLTYRIWEGILMIDTIDSAQNTMEVCVYNCRDLLDGVEMEKASKAAGAVGRTGGNLFQVKDSGGAKGGSDTKDSKAPTTETKDSQQESVAELTPSQSLIEVLWTSVKGPWEAYEGDGGTITAFDGMLVVRNNQRAQQGVQTLLEMLRAANLQHPRQKSKSKQTTNAKDEPTPIKLQSSQGQTYDPNNLSEIGSDSLKTIRIEEKADREDIPDRSK